MKFYTSNVGNDEEGDGTESNPFRTTAKAYQVVGDGDIVVERYVEEAEYQIEERPCGCKVATCLYNGYKFVVATCSKLDILHTVVEDAMEKCREEFSSEREDAAVEAIRAVDMHTGIENKHMPKAGTIHHALVVAEEMKEDLVTQLWKP